MRPVVAVVALACLLCGASTATARTFTVERGAVTAKLRYHKDRWETHVDRLTIVRAGKTLVNRKPRPSACRPQVCAPIFGYHPSPLVIRDLDGGEPEVVYSSYWGGAHCCFIAQVYRFDTSRGRYRARSRNFGDPGYTFRDIERDGHVEWMSADDRFAYAFSSYAASGLPLRIWHFRHGRFFDVTNRYPGRIRHDARRFWRSFWRHRHRRDGEQRGAIAAWAADEYRLGRRRHALRVLRREARHGHLEGYTWTGRRTHGRRFVRRLDRFLRKRGY